MSNQAKIEGGNVLESSRVDCLGKVEGMRRRSRWRGMINRDVGMRTMLGTYVYLEVVSRFQIKELLDLVSLSRLRRLNILDA